MTYRRSGHEPSKDSGIREKITEHERKSGTIRDESR